LVIILSKQIS